MPAVSQKQRIAMSIAEHDPEKLYPENRELAKMSKKQLHEFSSTKGKLPYEKRGSKSDKKHTHGTGRHQRSRGSS